MYNNKLHAIYICIEKKYVFTAANRYVIIAEQHTGLVAWNGIKAKPRSWRSRRPPWQHSIHATSDGIRLHHHIAQPMYIPFETIWFDSTQLYWLSRADSNRVVRSLNRPQGRFSGVHDMPTTSKRSIIEAWNLRGIIHMASTCLCMSRDVRQKGIWSI